jgi:hypothetical protein
MVQRPPMIRLAFLCLALSIGANAGYALAHAHWLAIPAVMAGWYVADMASGLVHMVMDYRPCRTGIGLDRLYFYAGSRESDDYQALFRATMARLGPLERLVYDFKNHHPRPDALGRRSVTRLIGSTVVAGTLPLSLAINLACLLWPVPGWIVAGLAAMLIGATFAQYFHGSLHRADNPPIVTLLRRLGLLMTPAAHQRHHDTLRRDFSTNCGWSNPVLNRLFALAHRRGWLRDEGLEPVA